MLELNKFPDILGPDFECLAEPVKMPCPAMTQGPELFSNGDFVCPYCQAVVQKDDPQEGEFFDEEEEDEEFGQDTKKDVEYVGEGESVIDQTPEEAARVVRKDKLNELAIKIEVVDPEFSVFMANNSDEIIDTLRRLELAEEPLFIAAKGIDNAPKIIAIASFMFKRLPNPEAMKIMGKKKTIIQKITRLNLLLTPYKDNTMASKISYVGKALGIGKAIVSMAIEEYERNRPTNKVLNEDARAAAWLFIVAKRSNVRITKKELFAIPGIPKAPTNRAIKSYQENIDNPQKLKGQPEGVD